MAEQAAEAMLAAAARGVFLPGDRLVEAVIARELGISRVPVREALRLLEANGIVVNQPYRGMRLMQVSNRSLAELMRVRLALETLAVRDAAAAAAAGASTALLHEAHARFTDAATAADPGLLVAADRDVHAAIIALGGSETLLAIWEGLARRLAVLWGFGHAQRSPAELADAHASLIAAIESGDADLAEAALRRHVGWCLSFDVEAAVAKRRRERGDRA